MKKEDEINGLNEIAMKNIVPPDFRAREHIDRDGIVELAESIKQNGLINPITLKRVKNKFEIIAGERRFMACKKLGRKTIMANILNIALKDAEVLKYDENIKRENLSAVEEGFSLKHLKDTLKLSENALAKRVGKSNSYINQHLGIVDYRDRLLAALKDGLISFSAARELSLIQDERVQDEYVRLAVKGGISPTLAKQWREDYEHMEKIKDRDYEDERVAVEYNQVDEVQLPCQICGAVKKASESVMLRICLDCKKEITK